MLTTLLIASVFFLLFFALMSLGLLQGKSLKGTCGGLNKFKGENGQTICEACAPEQVEKLKQKLLENTPV